MIDALKGSAAAPVPRVERDSPEKVHDAARQFEALLIAQMMRTMRSDGGWLGTGEDQAGASAMELAEEQFASAMAERGGFGVAAMITGAIAPKASKSE